MVMFTSQNFATIFTTKAFYYLLNLHFILHLHRRI